MESKHTPPRGQSGRPPRRAPEGQSTHHRRPPRRGRRRKRSVKPWLPWAGGALVLALILALALGLRRCGKTAAEPEPSPGPAGPGSAFAADATAPPFRTAEGSGGRKVEVGAFQTGFNTPESLSVGVLRSVDLTALGDTVRQNAAASGWGEVVWSLGENGELLLRNASQIVLSGTDFQKQQDFLASGQPENLARTFLENSGLVPLLRDRGLSLSLEAENEEGMITFRGTGTAPGEECTLAFSFLYNGAFNQAVLRATTLEGAVSTDRVLTPLKAAENAVTWSSADSGKITVTAVELRQIRGLPFYVLTGSDGTVAYALAVEESVLDTVPGAREVYRELLQDGIQEYVRVSGAY